MNEKNKRGDRFFTTSPFVLAAVVFVALVLGFFVRGAVSAPVSSPMPTFTSVATYTPQPTYTPFPTSTIAPSPTPMTSNVIVSGMQSLGQLVSVSVQLASVDIEVGVRAGVGNLCGYSAQHAAQGTISAGIDLASVGDESISYDEIINQYTVTLPQVSLLNCQIDYIDQYIYSTTACGADWDGVRMVASYLAINNFRETAVESGILSRAAQQAELIIDNFIENFTDAQVEVEFNAENQSVLPVSCAPSIPSGWSFDADAGTWIRPG